MMIICACPLLYFVVPYMIGCVVFAVSARRGFVITTGGAWLECRLLGMPWRRKPLGMHPAIDEVGGFGWCEIALVRRELARASGDHRELIADWNDEDAARNADARILIDLLIAEIARLHGPAPSERMP